MEGLSTFTLVILAVVAAFSLTLLVALIVATVAARRQHEREASQQLLERPVHQSDSADFKRGV